MSPKGAQTLGKAFEIVIAVSRSPEGVTFTDLQTASGQPNATLHRLLQGLLAERLLRLEPVANRYPLGSGLPALAGLTWSRRNVRRPAHCVRTKPSQVGANPLHMAVHTGQDGVDIETI